MTTLAIVLSVLLRFTDSTYLQTLLNTCITMFNILNEEMRFGTCNW